MENKVPDETVPTQDDLNLYILCMFKGTFSLDVAHILTLKVSIRTAADDTFKYIFFLFIFLRK